MSTFSGNTLAPVTALFSLSNEKLLGEYAWLSPDRESRQIACREHVADVDQDALPVRVRLRQDLHLREDRVGEGARGARAPAACPPAR